MRLEHGGRGAAQHNFGALALCWCQLYHFRITDRYRKLPCVDKERMRRQPSLTRPFIPVKLVQKSPAAAGT